MPCGLLLSYTLRSLLALLHERLLLILGRNCLQIRPYLMSDGGNVELVEIDGLTVWLRLQGACGSCPASLTTMTMGIKRRLMEKIPVGSCGDDVGFLAKNILKLAKTLLSSG